MDHKKVTDPPSLLTTRKAKDDYKQLVISEVLGHVEQSIQALRHQAMLTRDETIKREHAERRPHQVQREWQGKEVTVQSTVAFLADEFGPERATAAAHFMTEQNLTSYFERRAREAEAPARGDDTVSGVARDSAPSQTQESSRDGIDSEEVEHED